jgi:hypothetical protein
MAAASIVTALNSLSRDAHVFTKDVRLSMQTVLHTPMVSYTSYLAWKCLL